MRTLLDEATSLARGLGSRPRLPADAAAAAAKELLWFDLKVLIAAVEENKGTAFVQAAWQAGLAVLEGEQRFGRDEGLVLLSGTLLGV